MIVYVLKKRNKLKNVSQSYFHKKKIYFLIFFSKHEKGFSSVISVHVESLRASNWKDESTFLRSRSF